MIAEFPGGGSLSEVFYLQEDLPIYQADRPVVHLQDAFWTPLALGRSGMPSRSDKHLHVAVGILPQAWRPGSDATLHRPSWRPSRLLVTVPVQGSLAAQFPSGYAGCR